MPEHRISAAEAYKQVDEAGGGVAAVTICRRAHDGLLVAKAAILSIDDHRHEDVEIPKEFWWAEGHAALEQNWKAGDFSTWINKQVEWRAYGVTFRASDIDAIASPKSDTRNAFRDETGNFEPSRRCIEEVCDQTGLSDLEVVERVSAHCTAGFIASRCEKITWRVIDRYGSVTHEEDDGPVPDWFWEKCVPNPDTIFDWRAGRVSARGHVDDDDYKAVVYGLRFDVTHIIDLENLIKAESLDANSASSEGKGGDVNRGGRKRSSAKWDEWIAELAAYIHEEGIPLGEGAEGQDEVIGAIESRLSERGSATLARSTVQSAVRAVILRMRSAKNYDTG